MTGALKVLTAPGVWTTIGGGSFATTAETIAGTAADRAVTPAGREAAGMAIDPRKYGLATTATGAVNSAALQAAIDEACGTTDPVTTIRNANRAIEIPAGVYLLASPITIRSVIGLQLRGVGLVELRADTNMAAIFDINGAAYSSFENFTITGTTGVQVTDAFYTYWDNTGSQRSNTANSYRNITIRNLDFVTGFRVGKVGVGAVDVSDDVYDHIIINGAWATGEAARYQNGLLLGTGTGGNNLTHFVYHLRTQNVRYGLVNNQSQCALFGGGFAGGETAITNGLTGFGTYQAIRCETHQRLFVTTTGSSSPPMLSLRDAVFAANTMNVDGEWIRHQLGGTMSMSQVKITGVLTGVVPKINVSPGGGGYSRMIIEGLTVQGADAPYAVASLFTASANAQIEVNGYVSQDVGGHAVGVSNYVYPVVTAGVDLSVIAAPLFGKANEYWSVPAARGTAALLAGTLYTFPVFVPVQVTINRIGAEITVLGAGSTLSLGIYDDDGAGYPGALLLDAGTIDGGTVSAQEKTISQILLAAKVYHFAALCQGATPPTVRTLIGGWQGLQTSLANALTVAPGSVSFRAGRNRGSVSGTALPTPAGAMGLSSSIPAIAVRIA